MKQYKDIKNYNSKKQYHGYQEWYYKGNLFIRGIYKNNIQTNYRERHNRQRQVDNQTVFYIT
jgi:hypothetical protein